MTTTKRTISTTGRSFSAEAAAGLSPRLSAVLAIAFGAFLLFGAAFAQPDAIHDAAHDGRHSFAFPCH
ncbi:MAG: CbtB domain-containing protein [Pseudomonadota bacterium]